MYIKYRPSYNDATYDIYQPGSPQTMSGFAYVADASLPGHVYFIRHEWEETDLVGMLNLCRPNMYEVEAWLRPVITLRLQEWDDAHPPISGNGAYNQARHAAYDQYEADMWTAVSEFTYAMWARLDADPADFPAVHEFYDALPPPPSFP